MDTTELEQPTRRSRRLVLSELFGPTVQGEGPHAGRLATFIRFGLCNLDCTWCDTPYTWDWTGRNGHAYNRSDLTRTTVERAAAAADTIGAPLVVITGGEPFVQRTALHNLINLLLDTGHTVEVETNGTLPCDRNPSPRLHYNVSLKLPGADTSTIQPIQPDAVASWVAQPNASFKFVVTGPRDVAEVRRLVGEFVIPAERVWLMPEGRSVDELQESAAATAQAAIAHGWNFSHRLHVLCWGDERGR